MITKRQRETYDFIQAYIDKNGYAPTIVEIATGLGNSPKSKAAVHRNVSALKDVGLLYGLAGRQRNISLVKTRGTEGASIPLVGKIAAGEPIEAIEDHEVVDLDVLTGADRYALRVCGQSMIEEGIHDGDLVICQRQERAPNGTIVVALIDNESATLKRFQRNDDGTVTLIPANADYLPMTYEGRRVQIQGIFVGLLRIEARRF